MKIGACFCLVVAAAFGSAGLLSPSQAAPAKAAASPSFPASMQASWASELNACEPEFTGGFKIRPREVSYYDGPARLLSIGRMVSVRTPSGLGQSVVAKLRISEGGDTSLTTDRFTVVGRWLYHSEAGESLAIHLSKKNRMVRCPPGSTD